MIIKTILIFLSNPESAGDFRDGALELRRWFVQYMRWFFPCAQPTGKSPAPLNPLPPKKQSTEITAIPLWWGPQSGDRCSLKLDYCSLDALAE